MKKLIINADDFGRHALINEAVARAVSQGALRSATLMPGEPAFDEALKAVPKGKRSPTAEQGVAFCSQLFKLEEQFKDLLPEETLRIQIKVLPDGTRCLEWED